MSATSLLAEACGSEASDPCSLVLCELLGLTIAGILECGDDFYRAKADTCSSSSSRPTTGIRRQGHRPPRSPDRSAVSPYPAKLTTICRSSRRSSTRSSFGGRWRMVACISTALTFTFERAWATRGGQRSPAFRANDIIVPLDGPAASEGPHLQPCLLVHGVAKVPAKRAPKDWRTQRGSSSPAARICGAAIDGC